MLKLIRAQGQGLVSDLGRWGYQHQGVPVGGVMDVFSFTVGNLALGNMLNAACLELMGQFDFVCVHHGRLLFANSSASASLNGRKIYSGQVLELQEGDVLRTSAPGAGFWNLMCLQGGVEVPLVMGSRSTCLPSGFGGFNGRGLQVGDVVQAGSVHGVCLRAERRLSMPLALPHPDEEMVIHVLPGAEFNVLSDTAKRLFSSQPFYMDKQSSRMGYRLEAACGPLQLTKRLSLRSHVVHPGILQLPPSGYPVVLLSEAQVSGGYPRIASVLQCELWKFAHLGSKQAIRWRLVDTQSADRLKIKHEQTMRRYHHVIESESCTRHVD